MSDIILKAENISKQYRLGLVGTGTMSHDLNRWWHLMRGKEDPYLKIGELNDRSTQANSDYVWALKDINFEVKQGEVLGIIGKNGAGKSTLLKILSRVTSPTTGEIKTKGRIASLLEVGTGFHPEMTGRENIYLNGAILGMTKSEIKRKEDEIIDFSGCARYIDTPVKRYSSGMTVRMAFAVAAHLEPDIMVVDEVLAVGDAEFQQKAIGKMQDISKEDGRTVLFVSHNMTAIQNLCTRGIVLENGREVFCGSQHEAVNEYLNKNTIDKMDAKFVNHNPNSAIKSVKVLAETEFFTTGERLKFKFELDKKIDESSLLSIGIYSISGEKVLHLSSRDVTEKLPISSDGKVDCSLPKNPLVEGSYYINIQVFTKEFGLENFKNCNSFSVVNGDFYGNDSLPRLDNVKIYAEHQWKN